MKYFKAFSVGEVVWAKLPSYKWWPAIIINSSDCGQMSTRHGYIWLFWFGDHKISEVPIGKISNFVSCFHEMTKIASSKLHNKGVTEALEILAEKANFSFVSNDELFMWAENGFKTLQYDMKIADLPVKVLKHLQYLKLKTMKNAKLNKPRNKGNTSDTYQNSKMDKEIIDKKQFPEHVSHKFSSACLGDIVWAKLTGCPWWPAVVINATHCGRPTARCGYTWIFWFGDHKISEMPRHNFLKFAASFNDMTKVTSSKKRHKAIIEALEALAIMTNYPFSTEDDLFEWAKNGCETPESQMDIVNNGLPPLLLAYLEKLKLDVEKNNGDVAVNDESNLFDELKSGHYKIEEICISCHKTDQFLDSEHPLFKGGLCSTCKDRFKECAFALGDDGKNICCIVCSEPGTLILCDNLDCPRSYCQHCLLVFLGPVNTMKIKDSSPWLCFFCSTTKTENCFLEIKRDWEEKLMSIFTPDCPYIDKISVTEFSQKRPITVLSLFDGISTGKLVLDMLHIEIDKYYCCEIDTDAINVSKFHHKNSVIYIGDVCGLTEEKIESFGQIDLVIGGSPCNDLSLVNPARKGLYDFTGTGNLFFDFFHILSIVKQRNRNVFYLYENVAAMLQKDKVVISTFLMHEPALIDAKYYSPQVRARYFWGNIPGLRSLSKFWNSIHEDEWIR